MTPTAPSSPTDTYAPNQRTSLSVSKSRFASACSAEASASLTETAAVEARRWRLAADLGGDGRRHPLALELRHHPGLGQGQSVGQPDGGHVADRVDLLPGSLEGRGIDPNPVAVAGEAAVLDHRRHPVGRHGDHQIGVEPAFAEDGAPRLEALDLAADLELDARREREPSSRLPIPTIAHSLRRPMVKRSLASTSRTS